MDYHLKYLKYKNKYINLKNMIGNGKILTDYEKLINAKIHPQIVNIIIDKKLDINKAINLMNTITGIKDTTMRSLLILQLLINNVNDKKIKFLNNYLFKYNYAFVNNLTFNCILEFSEVKLYYLTLIIFIAYNKQHIIYKLDKTIKLFEKKKNLPPLFNIVIILNILSDEFIIRKFHYALIKEYTYLINDEKNVIGRVKTIHEPLQFNMNIINKLQTFEVSVNDKLIRVVRDILIEFKQNKYKFDDVIINNEVEIDEYNFTDVTQKKNHKFPEEKLESLIIEILSKKINF